MSQRDWYGLGGGAVRPGRPGCSEILPWLVVGEYPNYDDLDWLRDDHRITAVLSLQCDADLASKRLRPDAIAAACAAARLAFARVACPDGDLELLTARLPELVERLRVLRAGGDRVYLHCNAGMNRAPTVAIAAVHVLGGLPLDDAIAFVKARRLAVPYLRALEACYGRAPSS